MGPPKPNEKAEQSQVPNGSQYTAESAEHKEKDVEKGEDSSPERAEFNENPRQASRGGSLAALTQRSSHPPPTHTEDGRRIMQEEDCWEALGYQWPTWKKVGFE